MDKSTKHLPRESLGDSYNSEPVIFTGSLQGRITTQGDPCIHYREWVCGAQSVKKLWESNIIEFSDMY